jgi:hypothetical protein
MTDKDLFKEVFDRIAGARPNITMYGTLVCLNGEPKFNTDGYSLAYNLYRFTNLLKDNGEFI